MATLKQKKAIKKLVENGGKSVSQAMREAGYSEATAKTPSKLTKSDGWQELMDKYMPDKLIAKTHKELFKAGSLAKQTFNDSIPDKVIKKLVKKIPGATFVEIVERTTQDGKKRKDCYYIAPDARIRKDAVELAGKMKGKFAPEQIELGKMRQFEDLPDDELDRLLKEEAPPEHGGEEPKSIEATQS